MHYVLNRLLKASTIWKLVYKQNVYTLFEKKNFKKKFLFFFHHYLQGNNLEIIKKFFEVYSKFYEWNASLFQRTKNCDGLTIQDLYTYTKLRNSKNFTPRTNITNLPEYFKRDSNPISICKFINQVSFLCLFFCQI